jgi:hypothetical protein
MKRDVMWAPWSGPGLEHLHLARQGVEIVANGVVIGMDGDEPFRAWYEIRCDAAWKVRRVLVMLLGDSQGRGIVLDSDGGGHWTTERGSVSLEDLDNCLGVDLSMTPFTNTLAIRRLALKPGESRDVQVASIDVPELTVAPAMQRYTCLETNPSGGLYRYEALSGDFTSELRVDADGLVLDYPEAFRRV